MRRLITVFALIAALFILMGCGMGSKENIEQGAPVPSVDPKTSDGGTEVLPTFTLFSGIYSGKDSGEIYRSDATELFAARQYEQEKELLVAQIEKLKAAESPDSEELKGLENSLQDLDKSREGKKSLEELEKELVAYHLESVSFEITMNEGKHGIDHLVITTKEDLKEMVDVPGDTEGETKKEERVKRVFGDIIKMELNKEITFDSHTGLLSFSFIGIEGENSLIYTFEAKTSDKLVEKDEQKIREVSLSGEIKNSVKDKPEMLVVGNWDVSQSIIDETPKKEELKEAEPEITTQDQE